MGTLKRRTFVIQSMTVFAAGPLVSLAGCRASEEGDAGEEGESSGAGSSTGCCAPDRGTMSSTGDLSETTSSSGSLDVSEETSGPGAGSESTSAAETTAEGSSSSGPGSTGEMSCEATPSDIEGPFYRPGIPIGGDLDVHGDDGQPLRIEGRILDAGCSPISGAVVEIWHATPVAPAGQPGDTNASYDDTDEYRYYGQVASDATGGFSFTTLRPGWYLNGGAYRPAHVHLKVWVGGVERLTTQLYFDDDPFNDEDPGSTR